MLDEATHKLDRRIALGITCALIGVAAAAVAVLVSRTGVVVGFAIAAIGLVVTIDSARKLRAIGALSPGVAVHAGTLGVATLVDAGRRPPAYGFVIVGGLVVFVVAVIAWTVTG